MNDQPRNPRKQLLRDAFILQLKLLADGVRDAILIPISLVAAAVGLLRGGTDCDLEFRRVIDLGRRSEQWINLFGQQEPLTPDSPVGSIDRILEQVETVVIEQRRKGRSAAEIRDAIRKALQAEAGAAGPGTPKDVGDAPPSDRSQ